MKDFKEYTNEAKAKKFNYNNKVKCAIADINALIAYGRKLEMDNKLLNPLLDAVKSIHTSEDAITKAYELSITPIEEPEEEVKEKPVTDDKW